MREPERSLGLSEKHAYSAPQRCMTCDSITRINQQSMCSRIRFLLHRVFRNQIGHTSLRIVTLIVSDPPQKQVIRFLRHPCSATCLVRAKDCESVGADVFGQPVRASTCSVALDRGALRFTSMSVSACGRLAYSQPLHPLG